MNRQPPTIRSGFSLMELVVSLMVGSAIAALAVMAVVPMVSGYMTARANNTLAQKAQLAMDRIIRELNVIDTNSTPVGTTTSFTYSNSRAMGSGSASHTFSVSGQNLLWDGGVLCDQVQSFEFRYVHYNTAGALVTNTTWSATNRGVQAQMTMQGAPGVVFKAAIFPVVWH